MWGKVYIVDMGLWLGQQKANTRWENLLDQETLNLDSTVVSLNNQRQQHITYSYFEDMDPQSNC
jgi:hypothetical protein